MYVTSDLTIQLICCFTNYQICDSFGALFNDGKVDTHIQARCPGATGRSTSEIYDGHRGAMMPPRSGCAVASRLSPYGPCQHTKCSGKSLAKAEIAPALPSLHSSWVLSFLVKKSYLKGYPSIYVLQLVRLPARTRITLAY